MKKFIIIISLLIVGCQNNHTKLYSEINKKLNNWYKTENKTYLNEAYKLIVNSKEFKEKGITRKNLPFFNPVFFELKKYDELDSLLSNVQSNDKVFLDNIKYLKYFNLYNKFKDNGNEKQEHYYVKKIIKLLNEKLKKKPNDADTYAMLFIFRSKIEPHEKLKKELDSIKEKGGIISDFFYHYILDKIENNPY